MTIEEFGKTIKTKYPQYNDLPDADLGTKMLTKYPEYKDMVGPELTTTQKIGKTIAKAAPYVGGAIGGIAGTAISPIAGSAAGAAAGYAGGQAVGQSIEDLLGIQDQTAGEQLKEAAVGTVKEGATVAALGLAGKGLSKVPSLIRKLSPSVNLGEKATKIAASTKNTVDSAGVVSRAKEILSESKIVGSTKQKALAELEKIAPDAPNTVIDALLGRRGVDKQIVRDLFGRPKAGVGKNVGLNAYRQALDEIVKGVPELAKIDKQLSTYYKIKDPILNIITNKTVQAVGGGAAILKLLGLATKD